MNHALTPKNSRRALWTVSLLGLALLSSSLLSAQDSAPTAKRKAARGRLPAYYVQVVAPDQKEKIYAIQKEYAPRLKQLREQLTSLQAERDAKYRQVLTPEQQKKVDELTAAAKAARDAEEATAEAAPAKKPAPKAGGN